MMLLKPPLLTPSWHESLTTALDLPSLWIILAGDDGMTIVVVKAKS